MIGIILIVTIAIIGIFLLSKNIQEGFYEPSNYPERLDATEHARPLTKRYDDEYFGKYYYQFQNRDQIRKVMPMIAPLQMLREATEHMLLLENSLFRQEQDITTQHFTDVERAIETAIKLDNKHQLYQGIAKPLLKQIQVQKAAYLTHEPPQLIAQQIRRIRQYISGKLYTFH